MPRSGLALLAAAVAAVGLGAAAKVDGIAGAEAPTASAVASPEGISSSAVPSPSAALPSGGGRDGQQRAREERPSRDATREPLKQDAARERRTGPQSPFTGKDPRFVAYTLMPEYGLSQSEWGCLDALWMSESDWDPHADNPTSSAYGIPQALTGGTHDDLPADYMTNPEAQIRWGLRYVRNSYGTACAAWVFKQQNDWY